MIKDFIPATKIVRAVLRKHGVSSFNIYTNDYKKCKTVKTYLSRIPNLTEVSGDIRRCLVEAGFTQFNIKIVSHNHEAGMFYASPASYIVRLPKE